jgi:hypothetical protein
MKRGRREPEGKEKQTEGSKQKRHTKESRTLHRDRVKGSRRRPLTTYPHTQAIKTHTHTILFFIE